MPFSSGSTNIGNIVENWIFDIEYAGSSSGTVRIALKDYSDGTNFYYGVILNNPSIRDSIDLKRSTAKTSNLTITIADFEYKGNKISEFIFGSVNYFINRNTTVKSVINDDSAVTIGNFRLIDFSTDGDNVNLVFSSHRPWDFISFPQQQTSTTNQYIPTVYGTSYEDNAVNTFATGKALFPMPKMIPNGNNIHFIAPKAYTSEPKTPPHYYDNNIDKFIVMDDDDDDSTTLNGDVTYSVNRRLSRGSYNIRPDNVSDDTEWGGSNPEYAIDGNSSNTTSQTFTVTENGSSVGYGTKTLKLSMPRIKGQFSQLKLRLKGSIQITDKTADRSGLTMFIGLSDTTFLNSGSAVTYDTFSALQGNAFIAGSDSSSVGTITTSGSGENSEYSELDVLDLYTETLDSGLNLARDISATYNVIKVSGSSPRLVRDSIIKIGTELMRIVHDIFATGYYVVERGFSFSTASSHSVNDDVFTYGENAFALPSEISIQATIAIFQVGTASTICTAQFNITDFYLNVKVENAVQREPQATEEAIENLKFLYSANKGLTHGITGLSGNDITYIHEAHLDLLNRFAGLDVASNPATNIEGWGNGSNDNKLDHTRGANGSQWKIRYWQLEPVELKKELEKLQYEGGFIFKYKKGNISNPQYIFIKNSYSSTDYTLTKYDISDISIKPDSYSDLLTKISIEYEKHPAKNRYLVTQNSINSVPRTNYNIDTKENVANIKLNAYISPTIPASPSSEPNDDFYTYYNNIFGDIKLNISGTIINPKFYNIDIGDTVDFSDMYPEKAFGKSFTNVVFMITSLSRTMGSLKFTAREIGAIT